MSFSVAVAVAAAVLGSDNGRAQTPPMGWRDWNQYQGNIFQKDMEAAMKALASPR